MHDDNFHGSGWVWRIERQTQRNSNLPPRAKAYSRRTGLGVPDSDKKPLMTAVSQEGRDIQILSVKGARLEFSGWCAGLRDTSGFAHI